MENNLKTHTPPLKTQNSKLKTQNFPKVLAGLATLALLAYLMVSVIAAVVITTPQRTLGRQTPAALGLEYRDVSFPARGGDVTIAGWYLPAETAQRAVVLVHGKDNSRTGWLGRDWGALLAALHGRGVALLLIDLRGHGASGEAHYSFGLNEQRDVLGAVDWLEQQGFQPGRIGVLGVSMGAASSILAAANEPAIGALVADCSYAEILPIIQQEWRSASGLPDAVLPGALLASRLLFGYNIPDARPLDQIGRIAPRPLLLIHGEADALIPVAHAARLHAAAPAAQLWQVPAAAHGESLNTRPREYTERVVAFFEQALR
ncbi:MAG: hypothetical protein OHK0022_57280 [Roseiflexaceae bacterium]